MNKFVASLPLVAGLVALSATPSKAVIITPADPSVIEPDFPGPVCDYTGAEFCSGLQSGNDSLASLQTFLTEAGIDPNGWGDAGQGSPDDFLAKVEQPSVVATEGLTGFLTIAYDGDPEDSSSGDWTVTGLDTPFVLVMKAGNNFAFNYFSGGGSGAWDTSRFNAGYSHATLWAPEAEPIPTPALLPGLVGMSMASLRRRKKKTTSQAAEM